eukprot:sb/3467749/
MVKSRSESLYSQVLNFRPHWNLFRNNKPTTPVKPSLSWLNIPPSTAGGWQEGGGDGITEGWGGGGAGNTAGGGGSSKFNLIQSPDPAELHIPTISEIPTPGPFDPPPPRPSYILVNGGPAYRTGVTGKKKHTPDPTYVNLTPDMISTWTQNKIFSPLEPPQPPPRTPLLVKELDRNLQYAPHAVNQRVYMERLGEVEVTPTLSKTVDGIYRTICNYGPCQNCDHPGDVCHHGDNDDSPPPGNLPDTLSCFSVLSTPFSYDDHYCSTQLHPEAVENWEMNLDEEVF